jgi:hypothetical protein
LAVPFGDPSFASVSAISIASGKAAVVCAQRGQLHGYGDRAAPGSDADDGGFSAERPRCERPFFLCDVFVGGCLASASFGFLRATRVAAGDLAGGFVHGILDCDQYPGVDRAAVAALFLIRVVVVFGNAGADDRHRSGGRPGNGRSICLPALCGNLHTCRLGPRGPGAEYPA